MFSHNEFRDSIAVFRFRPFYPRGGAYFPFISRYETAYVKIISEENAYHKILCRVFRERKTSGGRYASRRGTAGTSKYMIIRGGII